MVDDILNGEYKCNQGVYGTVYLLSRYYHSKQLPNHEIRKNILKWANDNKIQIGTWINSCIEEAQKNRYRLTQKVDIPIYQSDIDFILERFDLRNTRLVALSLLCYLRVFGDVDGVIQISTYSMEDWIGIRHQHISQRYIKELEQFGFLEIVQRGQTNTWNKQVGTKMNKFKINVPAEKDEEVIYSIKDNNILEHYKKLFDNRKIFR